MGSVLLSGAVRLLRSALLDVLFSFLGRLRSEGDLVVEFLHDPEELDIIVLEPLLVLLLDIGIVDFLGKKHSLISQFLVHRPEGAGLFLVQVVVGVPLGH
jgi:hypothetical protein